MNKERVENRNLSVSHGHGRSDPDEYAEQEGRQREMRCLAETMAADRAAGFDASGFNRSLVRSVMDRLPQGAPPRAHFLMTWLRMLGNGDTGGRRDALSFALAGLFVVVLTVCLLLVLGLTGQPVHAPAWAMFQVRFASFAAVFFSVLALLLVRRKDRSFWIALAGAVMHETVVVITCLLILTLLESTVQALIIRLGFFILLFAGSLPALSVYRNWRRRRQKHEECHER